MLGVVRLSASQAVRASVPRSLSTRLAPRLVQWQSPLTQFPAMGRFLHTSFPRLSAATAEARAEPTEDATSDAITEFMDLKTKGLIHPRIVDNITDPSRMGLKTMTEVQSQTLNEMLGGSDVLAQAKTGTGKTLAFLLPTMQNIINDPTFKPVNRGSRAPRGARTTSPSDIRALIISPTRELAEQIAVEARRVAYGTGLMVQTAVGGTQKRAGLRKIQQEGCHLLVGTPGRLKDILSDPSSGVSAPKLNTLILDEADRLLDQGFWQELLAIQDLLPDPVKVDRQTLMFSATVPKEVMQVVRRTMKPNFNFVKTIREDEAPTHLRVPQKTVILRGYENALPAVLELAKNYQAQRQKDPEMRPFKAIVYFNATAEVNLAAETFDRMGTTANGRPVPHPLGRMQILEIHSRLSQSQRTVSANSFRRATEGILFSSDVTARGMDFPEVTHVIQVGPPRDRETYIHRLGRTARANKTGEGWTLLHGGEYEGFDQKLGDLPLNRDSKSLPTAVVDMTMQPLQASDSATETITQIRDAMKHVSYDTKRQAYVGQLGGLIASFKNRRHAVQALTDMVIHGYGLPEPPAIRASLARNLGIDRYPGLNLSQGSRSSGRSSQSSSSKFSGRSSSPPRRFAHQDLADIFHRRARY